MEGLTKVGLQTHGTYGLLFLFLSLVPGAGESAGVLLAQVRVYWPSVDYARFRCHFAQSVRGL